MNQNRLEELLSEIPNLTIGLVGDLFLDRYLELVPESHELSIETGLEAYQIQSIRNSPGALGTVMNNLAALGVRRLVPISVIGNDGHGFDLLKALEQLPIDASHILQADDRLTPTYTKPMRCDSNGHWNELNRLDVRTRAPLTTNMTSAVCDAVEKVYEQIDGLIVLDQIDESDCGVVGLALRSALSELAAANEQKLIFIDSRNHLHTFDCGVLKGNRGEIARAASETESTISTAATRLCEKTGQFVYCTLGEDGIMIMAPGSDAIVVPACHIDGPIDIVGAGDSATAGIVCSLLAGATAKEAAEVANLVASITVQQLGTTGTATPEEVIFRWRQIQP